MLSFLPISTLFSFSQLKKLRLRVETCPRSHLGSSSDRFQTYVSLTPSPTPIPVAAASWLVQKVFEARQSCL